MHTVPDIQYVHNYLTRNRITRFIHTRSKQPVDGACDFADLVAVLKILAFPLPPTPDLAHPNALWFSSLAY